jgi:hypothetical protein
MWIAPDVLQRNRAWSQERVAGEYREGCEGIEEEPLRSEKTVTTT